MVFVHPPIAIASYVLVFAFAAYLLMRTTRTKTLFRLGFSAWLFTLLALVSGMIWAQSAWGSYWSWEPKEATAVALLILSAGQVLTGLGWANPYIAALIPLRVHVDLDAALLLVIIIHGAAGVKFASMRRRLSLPGGDLLLVAITVLLTAIVYYLAL